MPVGEILKDPITGIEYEVMRIISGRDIDALIGEWKTPLSRGSSMERCVDLGDRVRLPKEKQ